ncbi:MAG: TIGR03560 family F420-dependent LLM class oxidoreductase [Nitrososphaerales archaeon]
MRPSFGIRIVLYQQSFEPIKEYVLAAERLGFDTVWVNDHLLPIVGTVQRPMMECWTVMSALASITKRIRLGPLVLNNTFRHPQVVAKMASTLDLVSNGRLELGLGAGWYKLEHEMFGLRFGKHSERIRMLEESIELLKRLWTEERTTFRGRFYRVSKAICLPKPVQRPNPPLLIGGNSSSILNLMAKHADKSNFMLLPSNEFGEKVRALEQRCRRIGRDYSRITKSLFGEATVVRSEREAEELIRQRIRERRIPEKQRTRYSRRSIIGTPESCAERITEYRKAGAEEFMLVFPDLQEKQIKIFADSVISCLS